MEPTRRPRIASFMCLKSWVFGSFHKRSCLNWDTWHGACVIVSGDSGVGERRMEGLDGWAVAKPHLGADAAARRFISPRRRAQPTAGRPALWFNRPYGFPRISCRKPVFLLEHRCATFLVENSRPAPLTRPGGFGCNIRWIVRRRRVPRYFLRHTPSTGLEKD